MAGRGRPRKVIPEKKEVSDEQYLQDILKVIEENPNNIEEEDLGDSLISKELRKFEIEIAQIQDALATIKLNDIEDVEARLKAINLKITAQLKLPQLLSALDELKNKNQIRTDAIKGNKSFSPLEDGSLDDEDD